jgi:glycosyltransferase involved in cell wall biosynthesis
MRHSSLVVAGNDYIKQYALRSGASNVSVIPTVIDVNKYTVRDKIATDTFTIGWIGSPITLKYLPALKSVFEKLSQRHKIQLKLIGANKVLDFSVPQVAVHWKENEEVEQIKTFDVGIMPLEDNIWERGKCGYKLIQYLGCGVPVIGTPIGVNDSIIQDGINGFKASTLGDWERHLEFLATHEQERLEMGFSGRSLVESNYGLHVYQYKWLELLKK